MMAGMDDVVELAELDTPAFAFPSPTPLQPSTQVHILSRAPLGQDMQHRAAGDHLSHQYGSRHPVVASPQPENTPCGEADHDEPSKVQTAL